MLYGYYFQDIDSMYRGTLSILGAVMRRTNISINGVLFVITSMNGLKDFGRAIRGNYTKGQVAPRDFYVAGPLHGLHSNPDYIESRDTLHNTLHHTKRAKRTLDAISYQNDLRSAKNSLSRYKQTSKDILNSIDDKKLRKSFQVERESAISAQESAIKHSKAVYHSYIDTKVLADRADRTGRVMHAGQSLRSKWSVYRQTPQFFNEAGERLRAAMGHEQASDINVDTAVEQFHQANRMAIRVAKTKGELKHMAGQMLDYPVLEPGTFEAFHQKMVFYAEKHNPKGAEKIQRQAGLADRKMSRRLEGLRPERSPFANYPNTYEQERSILANEYRNGQLGVPRVDASVPTQAVSQPPLDAGFESVTDFNHYHPEQEPLGASVVNLDDLNYRPREEDEESEYDMGNMSGPANQVYGHAIPQESQQRLIDSRFSSASNIQGYNPLAQTEGGFERYNSEPQLTGLPYRVDPLTNMDGSLRQDYDDYELQDVQL